MAGAQGDRARVVPGAAPGDAEARAGRWSRIKSSIKSGALSVLKGKVCSETSRGRPPTGWEPRPSSLKLKGNLEAPPLTSPSRAAARRARGPRGGGDISEFALRAEDRLRRILRNVVALLRVDAVPWDGSDLDAAYPTLQLSALESPVSPPSVGHLAAVVQFCGKFIVHRRPDAAQRRMLEQIECSLAVIVQNVLRDVYDHPREAGGRAAEAEEHETEGVKVPETRTCPSASGERGSARARRASSSRRA